MINYAYPDLFVTEGTIKELLITDGTVSVSGTTYTVSGDSVKFENQDLEEESFELYQGFNSEMQITFGSCETARITFRVRKEYNSSDSIGKKIKVYMIPNHDASKMLQIGVYKIAEDKQSQDHWQHSITAYDAMYDILNADVTEWYNGVFPNADTVINISTFRWSFLGHLNVTAEQVTLVNDNVLIHRTINTDTVSGADIIKAICEINGVFGMITNTGLFRYKTIVQNLAVSGAATEIPITRVMEYQFSDYWSRAIVKLTLREGSKEERKEVSVGSDAVGSKYVVAYNPLAMEYSGADLGVIAYALWNQVKVRLYKPCTIQALGNPLFEPGDGIKLETKEGQTLYTYIFERKMSGVQALRDTYSANGNEFWEDNLNDSSYRYKEASSQASQTASLIANQATDFVEQIRNIGFRLLDEPSNVSLEYDEENTQIKLKWEDPANIATNEPCPATWAGTVVVRRTDRAPLHRWDGTLIKNSTTRDEHKTNALVDSNVEEGSNYYYGIFPYDTKGDYRFTKVLAVSTMEGFTIYSFEDLVTSTDISNVPSYKSGSYSESDISNLSQYFLEDKIMLCGNTQSVPPSYFEDGEIRWDGHNGDSVSYQGLPYKFGLSDGQVYFPIEHTEIKAITFDAKFDAFCGADTSDEELYYNNIFVYTAAVVDGTMTPSSSEVGFGHRLQGDAALNWTTVTLTFDTPVDADYIVIHHVDGAVRIKNIEIEGLQYGE